MNKKQGHLHRRWPAWLVLALLAVAGLYSLAVWSFFMFEGGWQMGLACLILLMAPAGLLWLLVPKRAARGLGKG